MVFDFTLLSHAIALWWIDSRIELYNGVFYRGWKRTLPGCPSDPSGYWWPPANSTWTPTITSFNFSVSLIVAQCTIFSSFSVPKLLKPFWGPKRRFWENYQWHIRIFNSIFTISSCNPRIYLSNEVFYASNGDRMPKLRLREVDVPTYPNGAHSLVFHLLGLGFWMFKVFHFFLNNITFEPHCSIVQRHVATTSLLKDKLPSLELVLFLFCV